jgi:hypothetical protein
MIFGGSQRAFWINQAEAVGQIISTRLMLYQGEWFLDTTDGTPWNTQVLGNRTDSTRDPVIQARVLSTPDVASISGYNSQVIAPTRVFNAAMSVNTTFGPVSITAQLPSAGVVQPLPPGQYITFGSESPYTIQVQWSPIPVFTLDDPSVSILDSPTNLLG